MGTDTGDGGTETYVVMFRVEVTVVAMEVVVVVTGKVRAEETVVVVVEDLEVLAVDVEVGEEVA